MTRRLGKNLNQNCPLADVVDDSGLLSQSSTWGRALQQYCILNAGVVKILRSKVGMHTILFFLVENDQALLKLHFSPTSIARQSFHTR